MRFNNKKAAKSRFFIITFSINVSQLVALFVDQAKTNRSLDTNAVFIL
jgi:hypothetical protein